MPSCDCLEALERLLQILTGSLTCYLADARPWGSRRQVVLREKIEAMAQDQGLYAGRLARMIYQRGGRPESGAFPSQFTDVHDLSVGYLLGRLIDAHRADIAEVEACLDALAGDPAALALGQEILGNLRGHLENLQSAAKSQAAKATAP